MVGVAEFGRIIAALACGLVAILFLMIAAALPSQLQEQAANDRLYYRQFRIAAAYAADHADRNGGRLPSDAELGSLGDASSMPAIWHSLSASGGDCDGGFKQEPNDRFTLWFWRGEWGECYAHPSGKTTLSLSASGYLREGLAVQWASWWVIGLFSGYFSYRLVRGRRVRVTDPEY